MESLISIFITVITIALLYSYVAVLVDMEDKKSYYTLIIQIMKLEELMAESELLDVSSDSIEILYRNEVFTIKQDDNRLVKTIGYQILVNDVHNVMFYMEDEVLFIVFEYKGKEFEFGIYKKEWWRD